MQLSSAATELTPPDFSVEDVLRVVERRGGLAGVLDKSTDAEGAGLHASIGVSAVHDPASTEARLGLDLAASTACRRGDLNPHVLADTSPSS